MSLDDAEVRRLTIDLLTAPTARDLQRRIGASNLSNGCDYCLACNLSGDFRETPMLDRAWGGRVVGTALGLLLEERINELHPAFLAEHRMLLGELGTYGKVFSTTDLVIPDERHALDWKNTTTAKLALILDAVQKFQGLEPIYGRLHAVHKAKPISEKAYEKELAKNLYKITGYYGQLQLYGMGLWSEGIPVDRLSNVYICRDSTMWWDNSGQDGYMDPGKFHGTAVVSFDYDAEYAEAMWNRGLYIWNALEDGASVNDFAHSEHCFPCGLDARSSQKHVEETPHIPANPVTEVTFCAAA